MKYDPKWSDDPFINLEEAPPEEVRIFKEQLEAFEEFRTKGDPTKAIELGLYPPDADYEAIRVEMGFPAKLPGVKY